MVLRVLVNMPKFYADVVRVPLGYMAIALAVNRSGLEPELLPQCARLDHTSS